MEGWMPPYKRQPRIKIPAGLLKALAEGRETYAGVARALGTTYETISKRVAADHPEILRARRAVLQARKRVTIPGKMRDALSAGRLCPWESRYGRTQKEQRLPPASLRNCPTRPNLP